MKNVTKFALFAAGLIAATTLGVFAQISGGGVEGRPVITVPVSVPNGGTGLITAPDDNTMVGNGTVWQAKAIPNCGDATHALAYATAGNAFSCQALSGGGGSADTYVAKAAGTARASTTTLASDPDLLFTSLAAGSYSFDATFYVTNAGGTASWKYGFLAGSAPTNSIVMCVAPGIAANGQNNWLTSPIAGNFAIPAASIGVQCFGSFVIGSITTMTFQWAQQVSDPANTTLNAGSYMHVHKTI